MPNSLDLLVGVFAVLTVISLLSVILIFAIKNQTVRKLCFYIAVIVGLYTTYAGLRMFWPMYTGQTVLSVIVFLASIISFILERMSKKNEKLFMIARIIVTASVVLGLLNIFAI